MKAWSPASDKPKALPVVKGFGCLIALVVGGGALAIFILDMSGHNTLVSATNYATDLVYLALGIDVLAYGRSSHRIGKVVISTIFFLIVILTYLGISLFEIKREAVVSACVVSVLLLLLGVRLLSLGVTPDGWYVIATSAFLFAPPAIIGLKNWRHL